MAEETDLAVDEGQPSQEPSDEVAFGYEPEVTPEEEPEPQDRQPDSEPETDPVETERGYLRQQDYTRKTQELADQRRADEATRQAFQEEMAASREQMQQVLQRADQPQAQGYASQFDGLLQDPNLSPEDRRGVAVLQGMAQEMDGLKQTNEQLVQKLAELEPQFAQANQAVQNFSERQHNETLREVNAQLDEANSIFGKDAVDEQMPFVRRMTVTDGSWSPEVNPRTQQPYTVAELVSLGSGKAIEDSQKAIAAQKNGKKEAQGKVAPQGSHPVTPPSGPLTQADALAEIEATQALGTA